MTVAERARRLVILANGAAARHAKSRELRRRANLRTAYAMALELQKAGSSFKRETLSTLRGIWTSSPT